MKGLVNLCLIKFNQHLIKLDSAPVKLFDSCMQTSWNVECVQYSLNNLFANVANINMLLVCRSYMRSSTTCSV